MKFECDKIRIKDLVDSGFLENQEPSTIMKLASLVIKVDGKILSFEAFIEIEACYYNTIFNLLYTELQDISPIFNPK
jgi:hypothetical protein